MNAALSPSAVQDYERIAKAIDYLRERADVQPSLEELAEELELSPFHLQRLFTRWAGVSPKRFLQALTVQSAKQRLRGRSDVLSATLESGLSSPGRLHDLFVTLEAVTPGEFKERGRGLTIRYGFGVTPLGVCFVAVTPRGVCALEFADSEAERRAIKRRFDEDWANAERREDPAAVNKTLKQIFGGRQAGRAPVNVWVRGTNFQVQVWRALLAVPPGTTTTYTEIARQVGRPTAMRAVGGAIGANPVAIVIPCHRVLRADGGIGGYHWGESRKIAVLALEAS